MLLVLRQRLPPESGTLLGTPDSAEKDLMPAALLGDAELIVDEVTFIDREAMSVTTAGGETIGYDLPPCFKGDTCRRHQGG